MSVKKLLLIRHGKTQSNLECRYNGAFDEPLCEAGVCAAGELARSGALPPVTALISGPALRCRQTAALLFPAMRYSRCPMREIDFGVFKGKNADELLGNKAYEQWLETGCMGDIPGGGSVTAFKARCCEVFSRIVKKSSEGTTALVVHGGNIMAIMERFVRPKQSFYAYHIPNCGFFLCGYEYEVLHVEAQGGAA